MTKYLPWLLVLAILLSEIILEINSTAGFIYYAVLMTTVLILFSDLNSLDDTGKLAVVLMILPTIRIAGLFLKLPPLWEILVNYYFFLFLVVFYSAKFKATLGFTSRKLIFIPLAVFLGFLLGLLGNNFVTLNKSPIFIAALPLIIFTEEIFFRGLLQNLTEKTLGKAHSIILTSVFYAIAMIIYGPIPAIFFFFVSLVSCLLYLSTKNIFLTAIINLIVAFFVFILPKILS